MFLLNMYVGSNKVDPVYNVLLEKVSIATSFMVFNFIRISM